MSEKIDFVLVDKLSLISKAVMAICNYQHGGSLRQKKKQKTVYVNVYVISLIEKWLKSFDHEYLMERKEAAKKSEERGIIL